MAPEPYTRMGLLAGSERRLTAELSAPHSAHWNVQFIVHGCAPTICYVALSTMSVLTYTDSREPT
jgi:hypothetical protein